MAQSELTVTPPSPTPPTNFACTGVTGPNPPNYTKATYADRTNWGGSTPTSPPPYFDDGTAGSLVAFIASTSALASGTGATSGGTENTYPGTGTGVSGVGAVPASTSATHEGRGTETVVTATVTNPSPYGQLQQVSCLGNYTSTPNGSHASSDIATPSSAPTITNVPAGGTATGGTTQLIVTGTNFKNGAVVLLAGVPYPTVYQDATHLMVMNAPRRTSAGSTAVTVRVGATTTAGTNWTFT